jgi:hypothetical protein
VILICVPIELWRHGQDMSVGVWAPVCSSALSVGSCVGPVVALSPSWSFTLHQCCIYVSLSSCNSRDEAKAGQTSQGLCQFGQSVSPPSFDLCRWAHASYYIIQIHMNRPVQPVLQPYEGLSTSVVSETWFRLARCGGANEGRL